MTVKNHIYCDVCGTGILVRIQAGFLPWHPIRIYCPQCKILISGECNQDSENGTFSARFENATTDNESSRNISYYVECSGELLTLKIREYRIEYEFFPSPFIRTFGNRGDEVQKFQRDILQFIYFCRNDWAFVRRLHELWNNNQSEYLEAQMRDYLPREQFPLNNQLELIRGIHQLFLISFQPVLPNDYMSEFTTDLFSLITELKKNKKDGLNELVNYFIGNGLISNYEKDILKILNEFIDKFQFLIVAMGAPLYSKFANLDEEGTTAVSFDDVKHFYQDLFECIGDIYPLVVALNNLFHRGNFNNSLALPRNNTTPLVIESIEKLRKQSKSNILKFSEFDEKFNKIIDMKISAEHRNMIGHFDCYSYDGISQKIKYYPSCVNGKGEYKEIFLLQFLQETYSLFGVVQKLNEIVYQIRKIDFAYQGMKCVSPSVFCPQNVKNRKVGRNEPCPCGSGKKYKKCCG